MLKVHLQNSLKAASENYYVGRARDWCEENKWHIFVVVLLAITCVNLHNVSNLEAVIEQEEHEIEVLKNEHPTVFLSLNASIDVINTCTNLVCYANKCFCATESKGDWFEMKEKCKSLFHGKGELGVFGSMQEWEQFDVISNQEKGFDIALWVGAFRIKKETRIKWTNNKHVHGDFYTILNHGSKIIAKNCLIKAKGSYVEESECELDRYSSANEYAAICKRRINLSFNNETNVNAVSYFNKTMQSKIKKICVKFSCNDQNCYCYTYFGEDTSPHPVFRNWHDAHFKCQSKLDFEGLVWFQTEKEQKFVIDLGGDMQGMIGASNFLRHHEWMWLENRSPAIKQDKFQWGKDYNLKHGQYCMKREHYSKLQFIEESCLSTNPALCTLEGSLQATNERNIRVSNIAVIVRQCAKFFCFNTIRCYCLLYSRNDWKLGQQTCHHIDFGRGAVIHDKDEMEFLFNKSEEFKGNVWLAASDYAHEGHFTWSSSGGLPQENITFKNNELPSTHSGMYGNCYCLCPKCNYVDVQDCSRNQRALCEIDQNDFLSQY